jgi:hypothetical protein
MGPYISKKDLGLSPSRRYDGPDPPYRNRGHNTYSPNSTKEKGDQTGFNWGIGIVSPFFRSEPDR